MKAFRSIIIATMLVTACLSIAYFGSDYTHSTQRTARADICVSHGGSYVRTDDMVICILPGSATAAGPIIHDFLQATPALPKTAK